MVIVLRILWKREEKRRKQQRNIRNDCIEIVVNSREEHDASFARDGR